jgi:HmuY protein
MKRVVLLFLIGCSSSSSGGAPSDAAAKASADAGGEAGSSCSAAIAQNLKLVDTVATTNVAILSESAGARLLFIDASAGGPAGAPTHPYIYVNLETGRRVDVSDTAARSSKDWDLALKRQVIFTNGGDGGSGQGGTLSVAKSFDAVTSADAQGSFTAESFFDGDCNLKTDQINAVLTTFSDWYDYDLQNNTLAPKAVTYVVKGGTGKSYKLAIQSYYGAPDGGTGAAGALYLVKAAPL